MGLFDRIFGGGKKGKLNPFGVEALHGAAPAKPAANARGRGIAVIEALLGLSSKELRGLAGKYREFEVPKRTGGKRKIAAPEPELMRVQRMILRRILRKLTAHDAAMAFEKGRSIVTHAKAHANKAVVVRIDVKDFFGSITAARVNAYFRAVGWEKDAAELLTTLCTHRKSLPQGAPTSPRLANLVSIEMDARLTGLARKRGATYTRYADDITYSFDPDDGDAVRQLVGTTKLVLEDYGLQQHMKKKLRIRRKHQQQLVTGLVVNEGVCLPRRKRRWLRAVEHRLATGGKATLTPAQMAGWKAFRMSIDESGQAAG